MSSRNNKIIVVGTVYPGIEKYLHDYFESLANQSLREFDVLLANDGLADLSNILPVSAVSYTSLDVAGSVSSNRRNMIRHAIKLGYQRIVFTDCDDTFGKNRLEVVNELLDQFEIVVNDLDITDETGADIRRRYFRTRFSEGSSIGAATIHAGNLMGLSNTAARADVFNNARALTSGDSIAFDWYLWASLFHCGYRASFTTKAATKYRVYRKNIAGMPQSLDAAQVCRGIEVKLQHYRLMSDVIPASKALLEGFAEVRKKWPDRDWRKEYLNRLSEYAIDVHMWWENIRTPNEVGMT